MAEIRLHIYAQDADVVAYTNLFSTISKGSLAFLLQAGVNSCSRNIEDRHHPTAHGLEKQDPGLYTMSYHHLDL